MRSVESRRQARRLAPTSIGLALAVVPFGFISPSAIYSQQALGNEFTVNEYTQYYQHTPRIACSAIGRCIVSYYDVRSDTEGHITGALLAEDGGVVVRQRFLEETLADTLPRTSAVAWVSPETAWVAMARTFLYEPTQIRARRFDNELRELGAESVVVDELYIASGGEIAAQADGRIGVGFVRGEGVEPGLGVRFRVANGAGQPLGPSVGVSQDPPCSGCVSESPDVATNQAGEFVVVWQEDDPVDGSGRGVFGRRFTRDGAPLGPAFGLATFTLGDQMHPTVAMDAAGNFVAVWMGGWQESFDILARRFDREGNPLGPEFLVNELTHDAQIFPDVSGDLLGNWVVTWESINLPVDAYREIWGRAFRPDGSPAGGDFHVNRDPLDDLLEDRGQKVSLSESGTFTIAWHTYFPDDRFEEVRAARYVMPCIADGSTACLGGGRFLVRALWHATTRGHGVAKVLRATDESAIFSFFEDDSVEAVVKVLDGCGTNGKFWVFATGLTDVEVTLLVTDTETGVVWWNRNPPGTVHPTVLDIAAHDACGAGLRVTAESLDPEAAASASEAARQSGEAPEAGESDVLSLASGRFELSATFATAPGGAGGHATALPLSDASGLFSFFEAENYELVVKLVDVCDELGQFWFYVAGLTNLEVELRVVDTLTGAARTYRNSLGHWLEPIHEAFFVASCGGSG